MPISIGDIVCLDIAQLSEIKIMSYVRSINNTFGGSFNRSTKYKLVRLHTYEHCRGTKFAEIVPIIPNRTYEYPYELYLKNLVSVPSLNPMESFLHSL